MGIDISKYLKKTFQNFKKHMTKESLAIVDKKLVPERKIE